MKYRITQMKARDHPGPPRFDLKGRASIQKRSLQPVMEVNYAHQANERIH